jgi:hypothetical protein
MKCKKIAAAVAAVLSLMGMAAHAVAAGIDDPRRSDYFKTFEGKTIAFVPVTAEGVGENDRSQRVIGARHKRSDARLCNITPTQSHDDALSDMRWTRASPAI